MCMPQGSGAPLPASALRWPPSPLCTATIGRLAALAVCRHSHRASLIAWWDGWRRGGAETRGCGASPFRRGPRFSARVGGELLSLQRRVLAAGSNKTLAAGASSLTPSPALQVLELTAELQSLGGSSDCAVARGWAGAVLLPPAAAAAPQLDAASDSCEALATVLHCEVSAWLQKRGFDATAVLLGDDVSATAAASTALARHVGTAALTAGCSLAVTWRLVCSGAVRDPLGSRLPPPDARPRSAEQRPCSRLGRAAAAADSEAAAQPCSIQAASARELQELLAVAEQQLQAAAAAASNDAAPVLVLSLAVKAAGGRVATLHVLQVPQEGSVPSTQLLKLLDEVSDLHRRRRAGAWLLFI